MQGNKSTILTLAEICRNILASTWLAQLNTIKAGSKGSKEEIHTSKVKYIIRKGMPYIWVPEEEMHNMNVMFDERGSLAVASPYPGPLAKLLRSMNMFPARVALTGDIVQINDDKAWVATKSLKEFIQFEERVISESTHAVSAILNSSNFVTTSQGENMKELVDGGEGYAIYRFDVRSCMFIDGHGRNHEVDLEDIESSKADPLAFFSAKLIDGINRSEVRRRALILFCLVYLNANVRDAFVRSVDRKGFDVLGKVPCPTAKDGSSDYQWKEFRLAFKEEAYDVEAFCHQLVEMEQEVVKKVSSYSGLS